MQDAIAIVSWKEREILIHLWQSRKMAKMYLTIPASRSERPGNEKVHEIDCLRALVNTYYSVWTTWLPDCSSSTSQSTPRTHRCHHVGLGVDCHWSRAEHTSRAHTLIPLHYSIHTYCYCSNLCRPLLHVDCMYIVHCKGLGTILAYRQ